MSKVNRTYLVSDWLALPVGLIWVFTVLSFIISKPEALDLKILFGAFVAVILPVGIFIDARNNYAFDQNFKYRHRNFAPRCAGAAS
jgi:hypothetical protein